jgi:hypothetical protein
MNWYRGSSQRSQYCDLLIERQPRESMAQRAHHGDAAAVGIVHDLDGPHCRYARAPSDDSCFGARRPEPRRECPHPGHDRRDCTARHIAA